MLKVDVLREDHLDQVVEVHLAAFKGFFLSFLGRDFLRLFYSGVCKDPRSIGLVALTDDGKVAGFAVGAMNPSGFYSALLKRDWWKFSLASVSGIMRDPGIIPRLARAALQPSSSPSGDGVAMLMSICVMPEYKGKGAGKELLDVFLGEVRRRDGHMVFLDTDRDGNEDVNRFYSRAGFVKKREYVTREGRGMNEYVLEISGDGPPRDNNNNDR
ncbi:MAG TPA: GNAT family N-acetyltransferase [Nitrospirota bacterium]